MEKIFADSCYWIALFDPKDQLHEMAVEARDRFKECQLVTTEEVLTEFLTRMRTADRNTRTSAVRFLQAVKDSDNVQIIPQSHESFTDGVRLFAARDDKEYSLQDCISMNAMESHAITRALTNDHHFEQEGHTILL